MASEHSVTLRLKADAAGLKSGTDQAKAAVDDLGKKSQDAGKRASDGLNNAARGASNFSKEADKAARSAGRIVDSLVKGNVGAAQGHLAELGLTAIRLSGAFGVAAAAVGGLTAAALKGAAEQRALENAITASGNAAGTSTLRLLSQADALGSLTGEYGKARTALASLTQGGKITGDALASAASAAVSISEITGKTIAQATAEISALGDDPVKAVLKLNDSYHFLTLATYDQIKAAQEQGDTDRATELAADAAANALESRRAKIVENVGYIGQAYKLATGFVNDLWEAMKKIGQDDTLGSQIDKLSARRGFLQNRIDAIEKGSALDRMTEGGLTAESQAETVAKYLAEQKAIDDTLSHLRDLGAQQEANDRAAGEQTKLQQNAVDARQKIDALTLSLDKQAQKQAAIQQLDQSFAAIRAADPNDASLTDGTYERALASINALYAEHATAARAAATADRNLAREQKAGADAMAALADIARTAEGKLDPFAAAQDHYADTLEKIVAETAKAVAGHKDLTAVQAAATKATLAAADAYKKETGEIQKKIAAKLEEKQVENYEDVAGALDNYQQRQLDDIELMREQAKAGHELSEMQLAEIDIRHMLAEATDLTRDALKDETEQIRKNAAERQRLRAAQALGDSFAGVLNSTADAIRSGEDGWAAFGQAGTAAMASIGKEMANLVEGIKAANGGTMDWSKALESLGSTSDKILPALANVAGAIAIATMGNHKGGVVSGALSGAVAGFQVGGYWGAAVGAIIGGVMASMQPGDPWIYASSQPGSRDRYGGMQDTRLGAIAIDTDNLGDDAARKFEDAVASFDNTVSRLLSPEQRNQVIAALQGWTAQGSDIESILQSRLDTVLGAFGSTIADFVNGFASDLQGRVQALADVLQLQTFIESGKGAVDTLEDALGLVDKFAQAGERVSDTWARIEQAVSDFDTALRLTGNTVDMTKVAFADFAMQISEAAGGAQRAQALWASFFDSFYDGTEQNLAVLTSLTEAANEALSAIGLDPGTTKEQFREAFEAALPNLTPEQIVQWLEAGNAMTAASDAAETLAEALKQGQVDYASFIADLSNQGAGIGTVSPFIAQRLAIEKWEQDSIKQANELARAAGLQAAAEQDLTLIHEIAAHRIAEAIAALEDSSRDLVDKLYGSGGASDAADNASVAVERFGGAMTSAAQAASAAADLLLGQFSPLNDQEKLQYAIGAYQRGLVNKEDVLAIGRRLFASSTAYEDLFNMLQGLPGGIPANTGGPSHYNGIDVAGTLQDQAQTAEEAERERHNDAERLAQNVASLANAQDISFQEVADSIGLNLADLGADLGLNQAELSQYLQNLVDQENAVPDSIGDSTDRIIAALYDIAGREPPGTEATDRGHSTHARPGADGEMVEVPPSHSGRDRTGLPRGGRPPEDPGIGELRALVAGTNDRLDRLIVTTDGVGTRIVESVDTTSEAVVSVRAAVDRGAAVAEANRPRNIRTPAGVR